jgi:hypothetical protein
LTLENKANRSSAISVKLNGLNLAYNLGCCLLEELREWSIKISQCIITLWMEYDDSFQPRFITLYSRQHMFQLEIKDESSWKQIFNHLFSERNALIIQQKEILQVLLERLLQKSFEQTSLYKNCYNQISTFITNVKILLYSIDDTALHAIKIPLARYLSAQNKKKFKPISLNVNAKNDLSSLSTSEICCFNLNMFLREKVIPIDCFPIPKISKGIAKLKNCPKHDDQYTVFQLCKQRGSFLTHYLLSCWTEVVVFFIEHFDFDISVSPNISLSLLSYQTIWTKYSRNGGMFHQGLEKTKKCYEEIFRSYSHGGYSFSSQSQLNCQENLSDTSEPALTLLELDITSSYGYAGSHIQCPTGFCNLFVYESQNTLKCIEPIARHHTFEFLSVYYTCWTFYQKNISIRTVFSNFHQNGLFTINKYILDLAIITNDGVLFLYQFDGHYVHGCRQGCSSLKSYVNQQSRQQVEEKTLKRDHVILEWVNQTNNLKPNSVHYFVIANCHDKHYSLKELKNKFYSEPLLSSIIKGYPNDKTITYNDIICASADVTFIIILEGYVPPQYKERLPLIVYENKQWNRTLNCTNTPILLSKDYFDWLIQQCQFQITKIHQVFFYKKCTLLNDIYKQLIEARLDEQLLPSTKQLIKNVINYSIGFFGLNTNKQKPSRYKLIRDLPQRYNPFKKELLIINNGEFFIASSFNKKSVVFTVSSTPIPIFVMVIEYGKMRMSHILCFFETFLMPFKYKHLYSQVDNIILALSTTSLENAVDPLKLSLFQKESKKYLLSHNPGHLKLEWIFFSQQDWKFISPKCMTYSILTNTPENNICKMSSLNNLPVEQCFNYSLNLLHHKPSHIMQIRRINKVLNKNVKQVNFVYNKL